MEAAATTHEQLQAVQNLIEKVNLFASRLKKHLIEEPDRILNELRYHGLAPDLVDTYRYRFYEYDKEQTEKILAYINSEFISYLEKEKAILIRIIQQTGR